MKQWVENERLSKDTLIGTSPVVQWLRLQAPGAGCLGLIPGQGTRPTCCN